MARPSAGRAALLRALQLAQDVQGQAREHAAQGTRLPPRLSGADKEPARRVVRLKSARHRIRLVESSARLHDPASFSHIFPYQSQCRLFSSACTSTVRLGSPALTLTLT